MGSETIYILYENIYILWGRKFIYFMGSETTLLRCKILTTLYPLQGYKNTKDIPKKLFLR